MFSLHYSFTRRRPAPVRALTGGAAAAVLAVGLFGCGQASSASSTGSAGNSPAKSSPTINIGTKNFAEEYLITDMYQLVLQKAGFSVKIHDLAKTPVLQAALLRGDIDLYPEYTGTGLQVLGINKIITRPAAAYAKVKSGYQQRYHLTWLQQSPMNDTNDVAVTQATATKYHLHTLADLAKVAGKLSFAGLSECKDRPDCLGGMASKYGIHFKSFTALESQPLLYKGLTGGQFDAIEVFTTDGPIKADHLVVLKDNKQAVFPADHIAPVVRNSVLAKYPKLQTALNRLPQYITTPAMIKLNGQVILQQKDPMTVARSFLQARHVI